MSEQRQNHQLVLAFAEESRSEAPRVSVEGTESLAAKREAEARLVSMLSDRRARVLCVDDDEESRKLLSTLMRFSGIEVKAVATAAQALSLIHGEIKDKIEAS